MGKNAFRVDGDLSLHGATHPVTLNVTLNKAGTYPMIDAPALGFGATATIQRSAFGVGGGIPMVADALQIQISAEAIEAGAFAKKIAPLENPAK